MKVILNTIISSHISLTESYQIVLSLIFIISNLKVSREARILRTVPMLKLMKEKN